MGGERDSSAIHQLFSSPGATRWSDPRIGQQRLSGGAAGELGQMVVRGHGMALKNQIVFTWRREPFVNPSILRRTLGDGAAHHPSLVALWWGGLLALVGRAACSLYCTTPDAIVDDCTALTKFSTNSREPKYYVYAINTPWPETTPGCGAWSSSNMDDCHG